MRQKRPFGLPLCSIVQDCGSSMQHKIQPSGYRLPLTCVCTHSDQPCGHCKLKSQQAPKYECSETAIAHATPNGTQSLACPVWQLCLALPLSPLIDPLRCGHSGHCAQACNLPPYFIYFQKPLIEFGPLLLGKALHDVRIFVGIGGIVINWKPRSCLVNGIYGHGHSNVPLPS